MDKHSPLEQTFFQQSACSLAQRLLGKIIHHKYEGHWLSARIIETEAYYLHEKGSHSSLGYTPKRRAMFMPAGTIYMYYARGHDSFNISAQGKGNAVLIKSASFFTDDFTDPKALDIMQALNPSASGKPRPADTLCSGQTLLCRSLGLKVTDWDQQQFDNSRFYIYDCGYQPQQIIQTTRLGIPQGRDEHLLQRYIDFDYARFCSKNPLRQKAADYRLIRPRKRRLT